MTYRPIFLTIFFIISLTITAVEQPVVVIVPSYNNASCCVRNIESILTQDYPVMHIIFVDDCSTDGTGTIIEKYVSQRNLTDRVTLIRNSHNRKAMANIYNAVHMCDDHALITVVDGDDALAHTHVITTIVEQHQRYDAWISYAQFKNVPEEYARRFNMPVKGYAQAMPQSIITNNSFRKHPWCWSGLRSFYAWIFKQIRLDDLLDARRYKLNKFFAVCCDNAYFFPLLEMAGHHALFIPDVLLLRNVETPLNDFKINKSEQVDTALFIRSKTPYTRLASPIIKTGRKPLIDALIIEQNQDQLLQSIHALEQMEHIRTIHVVRRDNNCCTAMSEQAYSKPIHVYMNGESITSEEWNSDYLLVYSATQTKTLNLAQAVQHLSDTYAWAYFFDITPHQFGPHALEHLPLECYQETSFAFRFMDGICRDYTKNNHTFLVRTSNALPFIQSAQTPEIMLSELQCAPEKNQALCLGTL